jgi:hypothetical protein
VLISISAARKEMQDWKVGSVLLDPDLGSPTNLNLGRAWLAQCMKNHTQCSKPQTFTPTRLINVQLEDFSKPPCLVTLSDTVSQYAALSHCWGGNIEFKTLQANIEEMKNGLSLSKMPRNFQDAVHITRGLGLNYVWIDSLCIIQDSKSDWEHEAARMGDVYSNATVTIAAAVAENSTVGILKKIESPKPLFEIKFDETSGPDDTLYIFPKSQKSQRENGEESFSSCSTGALASRGWTLQERVLSDRMLYFGASQLFWSCCQTTFAADGFHSEPDVLRDVHLTSDLRQVADLSVPSSAERREGLTSLQGNLAIYNKWYHWLYEYTQSRKLTKTSDKLPALSGIASHVAKLTNDKYIAGLWAGDLCRGLLWQRDAIYPFQKAHPLRGPTWSWVNFDSGVHFKGDENLRVDESMIDVIDYSIETQGSNPFGEVSGGKLVLRAHLQELPESFCKSLRRTEQPFGRCIFDHVDFSATSPIWGKRIVLMLVAKTTDISPDIMSQQPIQMSMFGIQMPALHLGLPPRERKDVIQSLILREVDGRPDVFERIGQCTLDEIDDTCDPGEEDDICEMHEQVLTII